MTTNVKRVGIPFLFRKADGLGANGKVVARSYGRVVEGTFSRAGKAVDVDSGGLYATFAHSVPRYTPTGLLLEGASTNYLLRSQEFDNASWSKTNVTVTANAAVAPDGTTTADKVEATSSAATTLAQTATTITGTVAAFTCHGKVGSGASACNKFVIRNETAATNLLFVSIDWDTGDLTLESGSGTYQSFQMGGDGWWRIELAVTTGITSGDDIRCYAGFVGDSETANEYAYLWGAQLEAARVPSSYIATTSATVTRAADVLVFPFTLPPVACTVFVWGYERSRPTVAAGATEVYLSFGAQSLPYAMLYRDGSLTNYIFYHETSAGNVSSQVAATAVRGDIVELRAVLGGTGTCTLGTSTQFATESVGSTSSALTLASAWNANQLWVHSFAAGSQATNFAYEGIAIALGTKTQAEMRDLIEQGIF